MFATPQHDAELMSTSREGSTTPSVKELEDKLKELNITNQNQTVREIHDILQAYYTVARNASWTL